MDFAFGWERARAGWLSRQDVPRAGPACQREAVAFPPSWSGMARYALHRRMRLNEAQAFKKVFRESRRSSDALLTVLARRNGADTARLGLAVSAKHAGKSVRRNQL